ncbi:MAG: ABC transporter substrate-binding protein [Deltaproteobacteria bacterium]|nr:ABC transporter substrate-binding protein [Deltaproteobacteria bacterium]
MGAIVKFVKSTAIALCIMFILPWTIFSDIQAKNRLYTIGIAVDDPTFGEEQEGFKDGMAEKGYVEGKDIRYISYGYIESGKDVDSKTQRLLSDNADIILAIGNTSASWANKAAEGTDIKVLFCMINSDPVGEGLVKSLSLPGGNVTGIRVADSIPKSLEWLIRVVPGIKRVYLPYNPEEEVSVLALTGLDETAARLGIKLVLHKTGSVEEVLFAIENMPGDIDCIFRIPSPTLDPRNAELSRAAIKRGLPMGSAVLLDEAVLVTFSPDSYQAGRDAARLAHQIIQGACPGDLPVVTSEVLLKINLKTAEKIGIHIPDSALAQATTIIR